MAAFEGGGVRGAAYAGAYDAALEAGVRFSQLAGSSAGSIVAALVAVGAHPAFVKEKLLNTDFNSLRSPPEPNHAPFLQTGLPGPLWLCQLVGGQLIAALKAGGMYSALPLRTWMEQCLREAFEEQGRTPPDRPIRFSDLSLPLYIVAADVLQREPMVWCSDRTPGESVALAVQASCAIPFYFQPVVTSGSVLIDGGSVSNLPTHVFPAHSGHPGRFSDKTLAFRLKSSPSSPIQRFDDAKGYALGIADTLVTSATRIQQSLQGGIYVVEIDTGDIGATDFDRMTKQAREGLYDSGKLAVRDFIAREREVVGRHQVLSQFRGFDERLLVYVHVFAQARSTIWISDNSTYWLWFIFPALASAIQRGVQVRMAAGPATSQNQSDETHRRDLLRAMGCEVTDQGALSFTGVLVDYPGNAATAVISSERGVVGQDFPYDAESIKLYKSDEDLPVIRSLGASLAEQVGQASNTMPAAGIFAIEPLPREELFAALAQVRHYENARFDLQDVALDASLRVSQAYIKEFKLLQVAALADDLTAAGFELFAPCRYRLPNGSVSIITPPVVEITPQGPVMIEGHTRAFYAAQQGRERIRTVVVDRVQAALPVEPGPFRGLRVAHLTMNASANMPGYDKSLLRNIEEAVHK